MKTFNKILAAVALGCACMLPAVGQVTTQYHSDALVAQPSWFSGANTNLVPANYYLPQNPNVANPGLGIFEIKSSGQDSAYAGQGGVTFQLLYTQTSSTNAATAPSVPFGTNIVATFGLLLDDYTLQHLPVSLTNQQFSVVLPVQSVATNGVWSSIVQVPATNFLGCKYAKLLGFNSFAYTNGLLIQSFRAGYTQP